ncbi:methylated-DNA--[protein]-cysteine S-methyltransferase [Paenibacillus sp. NEAU-GSW1]|uniref:methylated-DNA--[protein]-cysteine S-methyltransferase n=1 Tax=Paenibacillus sp. NEAU-GSW1 TaxID=2682486 RepID=UPI0012E0D9C9|nr:methylated-DNA--[protein]-cysteine S-methyltransferase [Paenibacillus sp. NEAU-GSW1]MUT65723.1 methylated-DNA--[protein]-cysteine S-methyltransferase [Paenibacillus sp. NEAU-GSW1]
MKSQTINEVLYWTLFKYEEGSLYIAATEKGLCYVGSRNRAFEELSEWASRRHPQRILKQDDRLMEPYAEQLKHYYEGKLQQFIIPFEAAGTPFQNDVWQALREIPYGETRTYSDIAEAIGRPAAVRAVGTAIGANPVLIAVPCHRVIGKNGTLTGYRGGLEMKMELLNLERDGLAAGDQAGAGVMLYGRK